MMSDMRELKSLRVYYRDRPGQSGGLADYFRSEGYISRLGAIGNDWRMLARLTIELLKHMALDPIQGKTPDEFFELDGSPEVGVLLHFNRVVNIVGYFTMPSDSPEARELRVAVEENLKSRMFKAALMHRRLDKRALKAYARIRHRASAALTRFYEQERLKRPHHISESSRFEYERDLKIRADAVYDEVAAPLLARLQARVRRVGDIAFDTDFRGGFPEILTAFARRHVYTLQ